MARKWCVIVTGQRVAPFGPFDDEGLAKQFADYLTAEVDPAEVRPLQDPVRDLLAWRRGVAQPMIDDLRHALPGDHPMHVTTTPTGWAGHRPDCIRTDPHFFPAQCMGQVYQGAAR